MNDWWNVPPDEDDGIRVCPECKGEVEFDEKFKTEPINYEEEIIPPELDVLNYDGPWPPPGTKKITVNDGAYIFYVCPNCKHEFKTK